MAYLREEREGKRLVGWSDNEGRALNFLLLNVPLSSDRLFLYVLQLPHLCSEA